MSEEVLNKLFNTQSPNYVFIYTPPKVGSTTLVSSLRISLGNSFNIIHIHGNNYCSLCKDNLPEVVEFTFLNKKIYPLNKKNFQKNFPIKKLDFPSYQFRKGYILKFQ